ncbi:hypothetical protein N7455_002280, partial [Penicillium solitum]|uniref:uncharacterized protein n=1 Tax=Penicillium solitum TaxID=60172 RepID=UPI0032C490E0
MNEMNETNQNTSTSGMTSGVDQHRPFPCDQCSKLFTRSENLQRHKRARHGGASRKNFHDVYKRHGDRCRATGSPIQTSQPQVPWEGIHTPQAMVGVSSPLTTTRNPTERVVTDEAFWEEHSTFATELPQSFSSSSP